MIRINPDECPQLFKKGKAQGFLYNVRLLMNEIVSYCRAAIFHENSLSKRLLVGVGLFLASVLLIYVVYIIFPRIVLALTSMKDSITELLIQRNSPSLEERFSSGERSLFADANPDRDEGSKNFAEAAENQDKLKSINFYTEAIKSFKKAAKDPESQVYLNNAKARIQKLNGGREPYVLAAAIPASSGERSTIAKEMLRGIADAQSCFNDSETCLNNSGTSYFEERLLEVLLVDDANDPDKVVPEVAASIAEKHEEVSGVIGHYSTSASNIARARYERRSIAMISPATTSSKVTGDNFFRMPSSTKLLGEKLAQHCSSNNVQQVIGFINSSDGYSKVMWEDFEKSLPPQINYQSCQLSDEKCISQRLSDIRRHQSRGRWAVVLIPPSTSTLDITEEQSLIIASKIANSVREMEGQDNLLVGGNVLFTPRTLTEGKKFEGMVLSVPWAVGNTPSDDSYAQKAQKKWGGPVNWITAMSYDATQAFIAALLLADQDRSEYSLRSKVLKALHEVELPIGQTSMPEYQLKFDDFGESNREPSLVRVGEDCPQARLTDQVYGFCPNVQ
jgi:branched-chain amino acid transport system substrate-binding protein